MHVPKSKCSRDTDFVGHSLQPFTLGEAEADFPKIISLSMCLYEEEKELYRSDFAHDILFDQMDFNLAIGTWGLETSQGVMLSVGAVKSQATYILYVSAA